MMSTPRARTIREEVPDHFALRCGSGHDILADKQFRMEPIMISEIIHRRSLAV
jgi:hypothetical protein